MDKDLAQAIKDLATRGGVICRASDFKPDELLLAIKQGSYTFSVDGDRFVYADDNKSVSALMLCDGPKR